MSISNLSPMFRRNMGFDRLNDLFESIMPGESHYPPYNVEKIGDDQYRISVSAAGFSPDNLEINLDNQVLTITGKSSQESNDKTAEYLYKGISNRSFKLSLQLDPHVEVEQANCEHGLLTINLKRVTPEGQKSRQIPIGQKASSENSAQTENIEAPQGQ